MAKRITGSTPKRDRVQMASSFQKDDVMVFLISLKAGGTGLNLTAADVVIHYDPWWNVAVQNQATDRAHRIGQNRELKEIIEGYWKGANDLAAVKATAAELRAKHWKLQQAAGIDLIPSNDFSYYDQMLDTAILLLSLIHI